MQYDPVTLNNLEARTDQASGFNTSAGYRASLDFLPDGRLELRYYDSSQDKIYRSWMLSRVIIASLFSFWKSYRSGVSTVTFSERVQAGEFCMVLGKTIYFRESDAYGKLKMIGAELPADLVEALYFFLEDRLPKDHGGEIL